MHPIFKNIYQHPLLSDKDIETLAASHERVTISKGDVLLKEGKVANEYYILEEGLIKAFVHDYNNDEITTEYFSDKELVIAPASLFQRIPSQETLQALTDCTLWKICFDAFQQLYHNVPGFREWGRLWFSQQLFL
ncbi:Crp/Fnr family transcriptional regulator [Niabella ginsengisoli]|uniref:Cyclic nucleotide-binding domain-containing protein n=1 Tax=Niabella ginsengisoli TaxID=522298 RepID=A0ABS9SEC6_9BACT|nr:cyclic nucleotide-binding domain-containing protein [Niabella ginsengisoli]MCH5596712.1 cyclic nucleotide-binding domain-containing protein [Niabella ginsengisoli]